MIIILLLAVYSNANPVSVVRDIHSAARPFVKALPPARPHTNGPQMTIPKALDDNRDMTYDHSLFSANGRNPISKSRDMIPHKAYRPFVESQIADMWNKGSTDQKYKLAGSLESGVHMEPNHVLAAKMYRFLAEEGHPPSILALGRCYEDGIGVKKDNGKAVDYYFRVATSSTPAAGMLNIERLANANDAHAQKAMGDIVLYLPDITHFNIDIGMRNILSHLWYIQAADKKLPSATFAAYEGHWRMANEMMAVHDEVAANENLNKARAFLDESVFLGYDVQLDLQRVSRIARMKAVYFESQKPQFSVQQDGKIGRPRQYSPAKIRNILKIGTQTQKYNLAGAILQGIGAKQNSPLAVKIYKDLSSDGHVLSKVALAELYESGSIVPISIKAAVSLYLEVASSTTPYAGVMRIKHLAEEGYTSANMALGDIYTFGLGKEVNIDIAQKHYKLAADENVPEAAFQTYLGYLRAGDKFLEENNRLEAKISWELAQEYLKKSKDLKYNFFEDQLKLQQLAQFKSKFSESDRTN